MQVPDCFLTNQIHKKNCDIDRTLLPLWKVEAEEKEDEKTLPKHSTLWWKQTLHPITLYSLVPVC